MSTNIQSNRLKQQAADQKLIDGITKHATTITSLVIGGQTLKSADILATLQARLATSNAVQSTRATWQSAVKADLDERVKSKAFVSSVRQAIEVAFAGSIDTLADFGLTPRKKGVVSPEKRVLATAKARATRAARHTAGKKQKAVIKGAVPPTASASPPTSASPPSVSVPAPSAVAPPAVTTAMAAALPGTSVPSAVRAQ